MKKVYADSNLPYSQSATFSFPPDMNLCETEFSYFADSEDVEEEASIEGVFD